MLLRFVIISLFVISPFSFVRALGPAPAPAKKPIAKTIATPAKKTATPVPSAPVKKEPLKVVTTLSVLAAIVKEIGGAEVVVTSLGTATEDPHFIREKPTFKAAVADADLFVEIGRSLELWAKPVIASSQNPKLLSKQGVITVSQGVLSLEVPRELSRGQGDIHPEGNPHIWLSPYAILQVAKNIHDGLSKTNPQEKASLLANYKKFKTTMTQKMFGESLAKSYGEKGEDMLWRLYIGGQLNNYLAARKKTLGGWLLLAKDKLTYPFFTFHSDFSYLAHAFGLKIAGQIEEKAGIPPSLRYQNELKSKALKEKVTHIVSSSYYVGSKDIMDKLAKDIKGKVLLLDIDCLANETYVQMMDRLIMGLVNFK